MKRGFIIGMKFYLPKRLFMEMKFLFKIMKKDEYLLFWKADEKVAIFFLSANVHVWSCLFFCMCLNVFTVKLHTVQIYSESRYVFRKHIVFGLETVSFCYLYHSFYGYTDGKSISKFRSLKAREKSPLSAMIFKSVDINLLYDPIFNFINFESIDIINKKNV